jgi:TRAP-type C4-dicarboxylate transport system substrate-binding protein
MRSNRFHKVAVLAVTLATGLAGCGGGGPGGEKSGGPAAPHALRLGAVEGSDAPYADEVKEFAKAVTKLSNGSINIDIVWNAAAPTAGESETKLAHMVTDGKIDMAVVPTRVWDQLKVTSMQALQAPFLVDNFGLLNAIVSSDLAGEMLSGLNAVGVKGMAIWPDSLRHPIGLTKPLLTVADFKGSRLRVPPSEASYSLAAALGATTVDPKDWLTAASTGQLDGAESAFVWANDLGIAGTLTANITFYPKANAIVANDKIFEALSSEQQKILQEAATETAAYVVKTNRSEHDLAPEYCKVGGSVALASDSDIADLKKQAAPVLAELEQNAGTKRLVDEISTLKAKTPADPAVSAAACKPVVTSAPVGDEAFPEGVYRAEITNSGHAVVATGTFIGGAWTGHDDSGEPDCAGSYTVESGRIRITTSSSVALDCGNPPNFVFFDAAWTLENDELRFIDIKGDPDVARVFGGQPWTRIEGGADEPTTFPEGSYRTDSPLDGVVTMTYLDGVWQRIDASGKVDCAATFVVKSGRLWLTTSTDTAMSCGNPTGKVFLDAAWTLEGDQLRFVDIHSDLNAIQEFSLPWTKIG